MRMHEYQQSAAKTALKPAMTLHYLAPGCAAEAGEVAGKWAKAVRDNGGILDEERRAELLKEVGDNLWFLALICEVMGTTLDEVAEANLNKLMSRKERGVLGGSGDNR